MAAIHGEGQPETQHVLRHLASCADCSAIYNEYLSLIEMGEEILAQEQEPPLRLAAAGGDISISVAAWTDEAGAIVLRFERDGADRLRARLMGAGHRKYMLSAGEARFLELTEDCPVALPQGISRDAEVALIEVSTRPEDEQRDRYGRFVRRTRLEYWQLVGMDEWEAALPTRYITGDRLILYIMEA